MSAVYAQALLEARSQTGDIIQSANSLPLMVGPQLPCRTRSKLPCMLKLEPYPLQLLALHSGSRGYLGRSIFGKYLCAFKIYGICPQADRQTYASRSAVPLVWGSLRLAPINIVHCIHNQLFQSKRERC